MSQKHTSRTAHNQMRSKMIIILVLAVMAALLLSGCIPGDAAAIYAATNDRDIIYSGRHGRFLQGGEFADWEAGFVWEHKRFRIKPIMTINRK